MRYASEHDLVQALIEEFRLNVPVINEDGIYIAESGEAQVDVSRDPMRMIYDRSQAFYISGNKTVIAVPFEGDAEFFRIQPSSFSLSPPRAKIGKGELLLTYVRTDQNAEAIKREYQGTVNSIKQYRCFIVTIGGRVAHYRANLDHSGSQKERPLMQSSRAWCFFFLRWCATRA